MTIARPAVILLMLLVNAGVLGCADREKLQAERIAQQEALEAEDDAKCRESHAPGTPAYDVCRNALAAARAEKAALQEQRRREFDRILGAGTDAQRD